MSFMFAVVITLLLTTFNINKAFDIIERRGPEFLEEPQNIVSFLNDTGSLITCRAKGTPQPAIKWTKLDGSPLLAVPGLRQFRNDGQMIQLVYMPFAANDYRQDIHSVSVRCVASNSIGSIESRDSHIRAIPNFLQVHNIRLIVGVKQSYEVQVYDDFVIKGNTGILRCHIPSFVREYVAVTNWQSSDGIKIYSNLVNGGRFSVMPTGELHIHGVDSVSDSQKQYRCQTKHKLSGEVKLSANSGRLIVTESHSNMPPKIITTSRYIVGMIGETIELACSTQAYPRPEFSWFKINARSNNKELKSIVSSPVSSISSASKLLQFDDSLIIRDATVEDSAKYICTANNSVGRDRLEIQLLVRAPLNVILTPSHILVSDSDSVTFNCSVFGHPIENIIWKKNAKSILLNNRIKLISDRSLHISRIKREDRGMYQCIASNEFESFVSSAELTLSDDPPIFTHVFKQSEPYRPGHGLSLKCSATGLPLPQIVWTLDGSSMRENLRLRIGDYVSSDGNVNSYVNISSLRTEDGGTYSCIASNDVHSVIHSDRINVYGLPFVRQMSNVTAIAGQTVVIHCPAAGYPLESIEWYKKSSGKLPQNHRQTCLPNGTLIIEKIDRQNDEEMYSCVVNASSASASSDVYIKVLIAPVINPFSQPPNLREGMRGMLTCSVVEGDAPIVIEFLKDGMPLKTTRDGNIKIDASNEFSLTLLILKVSSEHSGNYTCVASNLAAKTSYSIQMIVNVPPKWIIPPANTEAIVGQNLIIDCLASGQPRVWWERSNVNSGIDLASKSRLQQYRSIISNSHMHTLENGSLTIREVSEEDSGEYLCQANNGVGPGLSKVIALKVHVAAHFKTKFSSQTVKRDQQILIICDSFGEIPISIILSKDRMQFDASLEPRYEIIKNERIDGFSLTLKIANCDRRDSALFTCIAANSYGKDEYNVQVLVEEPPDRPENVLISQIESRSAVLSWISAYSGNSAITSYEIEYKVLGTDWGNSEKIKHTVIGIANSLTIRGIKPINDYQIRIRAENKLGFSDWSQSIQFKTTEEAPSSPPLNIQVFPLSARSLQITWSAPNVELRNGRILGYYLGYKVQASDSQYIFKTLTTGDTISDNSNQLNEVKLTELKRSTKYTIIVQAFNSKGSGPQSTEVIGETLENDPPKAPILSLEEARHNSIKLNWKIDDIEDLLSVISGFYIYSKHQHSEWEERHLNAPINSYTFTDLLCGTQYQFYIVAYNSVGKGDPSQAIAVKTKGSVALPPQRTNALIVVNTSSAILKLDSWITNGCDIKYFIIKYKSKYDKDWSIVSNEVLSQQRFIELIDLMPANWYDINVIAVTDAGNTEQRYNFATLTPNGATVSPLDMSQSISYNSSILIPIICSVIVLTVILIIACFVITRRRQLFSLDNNSVHNCLDAHHVNNADSFHLSVLEPNKEINCSDANCVNSATKSSYFPTSYAMSSVQRKSMCCAESELSSLNSLRHNRHEQHVYDVPFPPKWV